MRTIILTFFLVASAFAWLASGKVRDDDETKVARASLPAAWTGTFRGKLEVYSDDGKIVATSPLAIEILEGAEGGVRSFKLTSDESTPAHDWELAPIDGALNKFVNDQKDGVTFETRLVGDTLFAQYEIGASRYDARMTLSGDVLLYEIVAFGTIAQRSSQSGAVSPPLRSYALQSVQRAILKRT